MNFKDEKTILKFNGGKYWIYKLVMEFNATLSFEPHCFKQCILK